MAEPQTYTTNCAQFLKMYRDLNAGSICSPRGQNILEVEDYVLHLDPSDSCITSFNKRKFNLKYAVNEFLWYFRRDKYDTSIESHASTWPKIKQPEGFYYSNYGQYIFHEHSGLWWVLEELIRDKDSRRAAIPFLNSEHCFETNKDMVCTYSMSFRIRNDRLNMSVNMRSNDAIFGTTNDVFCFWLIYKLVYQYLRRHYRDLKTGRYVHKVDSLHVYERHWVMLNEICQEDKAGYYHVWVPEPKPIEAHEMIIGKLIDEEFSNWLIKSSQS